MENGCLFMRVYRVREVYEVEQGRRDLIHLEEVEKSTMVTPFFVPGGTFKVGDVVRIGVMYEKLPDDWYAGKQR